MKNLQSCSNPFLISVAYLLLFIDSTVNNIGLCIKFKEEQHTTISDGSPRVLARLQILQIFLMVLSVEVLRVDLNSEVVVARDEAVLRSLNIGIMLDSLNIVPSLATKQHLSKESDMTSFCTNTA